MFFDPLDFPFTSALESRLDDIRREALAVREHMMDWVQADLHDRSWQVYGLYNYPRGELLPETAARCPITRDLIAKYVPTHGAAGFSLLKPQSKILPHRGVLRNILRCHLPLVVPKGDCAFRIESEVRPWEEGKTLVFDDRFEHEAWNLTDEPRIVLLFDFVPVKKRLQHPTRSPFSVYAQPESAAVPA